ncbi:non-ribosomal peptide synthetase [Aquimarina sp. AU474]|uniref:non-ribosomal peptide synthetase n=1 Tax=Aquimarina sp. AU474 TaxID=2108529 RepID=UPI000D69C371|nr:non-ribosomal peptide synthetase [Aquimarina sp. AU474]
MSKNQSNLDFNFLTLNEMLSARCQLDKVGVGFIEGTDKEEFLSYTDLYNTSLKVLAFLQNLGVQPKSELVIQVENNRDFILLFWACVFGGIIPVPVTVGYKDESLTKLINIWEILNDPYFVSTQNNLDKINNFISKEDTNESYTFLQERFIDVSNITIETNRTVTLFEAKEDDLAFIQFSSGSTGSPKGVMLTHKNLLTNLYDISTSAHYDINDKMLSWMPLTHDMGLIGFHLNPMFMGVQHYLIPTNLFVRRPFLWLEKISKYRVTISCSPNFGYHYLLKNWRDINKGTLDLSCLRIIYNGAEPISVDIVTKFIDKFEEYGLNNGVIRPVYGLAEASLAVSMSGIGEPIKSINLDRNHLGIDDKVELTVNTEKSTSFVNVGGAIEHCKVRITNTDNVELSDNHIGVVQIKGDNVTKGYYNNKTKTSQIITPDGWLNTEDLGFLSNGSLYITGRSKDVIFKNGQNFYCHDIERIAENVDGVELNKIAVSGYFNPYTQEEEVIAFIIHKQKLLDFVPIITAFNTLMSTNFGIAFTHVIPVRKIPKTTSGKLQRFRLLQQYKSGLFDDVKMELDALLKVSEIKPIEPLPFFSSDIEQKLYSIWQKVLMVDKIEITDDFFSIGGNSLRLAEVSMHIYEEFDIELPLNILYENHTIASTAKQISEYLRKKKTSISVSVTKEKYNLSSAQKMLFYAWEVNRDSLAYNNPSAFIIGNEINIEKLQDSIRCLIQKNSTFKMYFNYSEDLSFSYLKDAEVNIRLDECEEKEKNNKLKSLIRPFDLSNPPLFRIHILHVSRKYFILFLDFHHIIFDGISVYNFLEDLSKLYDGRKPHELVHEYQDYVAWEKETFLSERFKRQEEYWNNHLSDAIPILNLPTDFNRPSIFSQKGGKIDFLLEAELVSKLKTIASENSCTIFVVLLTIYQLFLSKYCQQKNIVIGVPVSGRNHVDLLKMYGMFVNNIVVKSVINDKDNFIQLLEKQKRNMIEGLKNQEYPFYKLIENSTKERDVSRNPIFDTMFVFQNMGIPNVTSSSLTYKRQFFDPGYSKFDLSLEIFDQDSVMECAFEYNSSLFRKETIKQFVVYFKNLVSQVVNSSNGFTAEFQLIDKKEYDQKIKVINDTTNTYPKNNKIHELIEKVVAKKTDAIAMVFGDTHITYAELNRKANRLAHYIRNQHDTQGPIIVFMDRTPDFLISILAILKSGTCFLPIDVEIPRDRLEFILADSKSKMVITNSKYADRFDNLEGPYVLDINEVREDNSLDSSSLGKIKTGDIAYVIYTSGTSGDPKGVVVGHKSLVNYISWAAKYYLNDEESSFPLFTSIAFDLSITSIFIPLITGNKIIIYEDIKHEVLIKEVVLDNKVDIIKLTPSHLKILKEIEPIFKNSRIKKIIVGGEKFDVSLAHQIYNMKAGEIEIYNEYGPTEATVGCMIYDFNIKENLDCQSVPIGKPINNTSIYVLNTSLTPVPLGAKGEIYISGDCLSMGYLFNEKLTNQTFIPNPFIKGHFMYKTGDLAKYLSDGNIEYIGRRDSQIKINGYRVELSAIEECFRNCTIVEDAIVVLTALGGEDALTAYYKLIPDFKGNSVKEIRTYLTLKLPRYMIPSHLIVVECIPLTVNGKPDYKALPSPIMKLDKSQSEKSYTKVEELLIQAWEEILLIENITLTDNFFELGGDSIKAVRIASMLRQNGILIEGKDILTFQTIEVLSSNVNTLENKSIFEQDMFEGDIPWTPILTWFFEKEHQNSNYYNQSVLLNINSSIEIENLQKVFREIITHHDAFRLNFNKELKTIYYNNDLSINDFVLEEIFVKNNDELNIACEEIKKSINIEHSVLLRAAVFYINEKQKHVFITSHHLAVDGISWRILLTDLYKGYSQISKLEKIRLPKKSASFKIWSHKLKELALSPKFEQELDYWNNIESTIFELPKRSIEKKHPTVSDSAYIQHKMSQDLTTDLLHNVHDKFGTDTSILLMAALIITLNDWKQFKETIVHIENHGRLVDGVEVYNTIGWFTNLYPVKLQYDEDMSSVIKKTKETIKGVPSNGIGYGINKYEKGKLSTSNEVPEIIFNYLGNFNEKIKNDLFSLNTQKLRVDSDPLNFISAYWEWNLMIINNKLNFEVTYDSRAFSSTDMNTVVQLFEDNLIKLIQYIKKEENIHFTPSDFNTLDLDQTELNALFD